MKLLSKMLALVATKFEGKYDKGGTPYFMHCYHVMKTCGLKEENELCIALGHDLIEDTDDVTFDYLRKEFNETVALGIYILTRDKEDSYEEYIKQISSVPEYSMIKIADLKHNMDMSRIKRELNPSDTKRIKKYYDSYLYLSKNL